MLTRSGFRCGLLTLVGCAVLAAPTMLLAAPPRYSRIRIQWFDIAVYTTGINEAGMVCGISTPGNHQAFIWSPPTGPLVNPFGFQWSKAYGINELGWFVGKAGDLSGSNEYAILWTPNASGGYDATDLGNLGQAKFMEAYGINDFGQIVGTSGIADTTGSRAFLWQEGVMTQLPGLADTTTVPKAINNAGVIVGFARTLPSGQYAVMWRDEDGDGQYTIETLIGGTAYAINDKEEVVGEKNVFASQHAFYLNEFGANVDLHNANLGYRSSALGLNNNGEVVGYCMYGEEDDGTSIAFIWNRAAGMRDLNALVPPDLTGHLLDGAFGINDAGQIAARGRFQDLSDPTGYLLSPVYPSMDLSVDGRHGTLKSSALNTLEARGAFPGETVFFYYSQTPGGSPVGRCDLRLNSLQIDAPLLIGSAIANTAGNAELERYLPPGAAGKIVFLQAAVPDRCAVSQLLIKRID